MTLPPAISNNRQTPWTNFRDPHMFLYIIGATQSLTNKCY